MQSWAVTFCVVGLLAMIMASWAVKVSSPPDPRTPLHEPAAVREGAVMFPNDRIKQGEVVALKDLMKKSISNLQELVDSEDSHLNMRISKGLNRLNERLEEGDDRLKEELDEDVAWMKERIIKGLNYVKELVIEGDLNTDRHLTKLKEAFEKGQQDDVKQSAVMVDLRQQMVEFRTELNSTKHQLKTTQTELKTTQTELKTTQTELNSTKHQLKTTQTELNSTKDQLQAAQTKLKTHQEALQSTRVDLNTIRDSLQSTRQQLHEEQQASAALKAQLMQEIHSLKVEVDSVQSNANSVSSELGSTFTRWGRKTCPDNTSLVYSGYVGGQFWDHTGGGSNYLCLVRDPQLDNMTLPARYNLVHGAEYQYIDDQHNQDAVCSVCRAPQPTTLMIPATLSCPPGWTTQYRGHLVSGHNSHKGRNEFVCLDQAREHRDGGQSYEGGTGVYYVITDCGPLPCPPYTNKVVTCVVCSQ